MKEEAPEGSVERKSEDYNDGEEMRLKNEAEPRRRNTPSRARLCHENGPDAVAIL